MNAARFTAATLTSEAFSPFGEVIETAGASHHEINDGFAERYHDLARVEVAGDGARVLVNIFAAKPRPTPLRLDLMERHPLGSQAFFPLDERDWLVVVAGGDDPLDPANIAAFRATGRQGVNYARGVWHHPLLVVGAAQRFIVIDRGGPGDNLEERRFNQVVEVDF